MEQLALFPDLHAARPKSPVPFYARDVVFFGIRLSELGNEAADVHRMLKRSHGLTGIPYQASRLHVSLLRVGDREKLSAEDLEALGGAASRVRVTSFPISFEKVFSFDGNAGRDERRAVVFPVAEGAAEVIALARDIEDALDRRVHIEGQPPPSPHMTLLRDRVRVPPTSLDPPFGARVTGFELICSHRIEHRYSKLWP